MKRALTLLLALALTVGFSLSDASAGEQREKFGVDPRHKIAERVTFKPSTEKIRWKMVMPWSKGLLFYDIAAHFCDSVRASGVRRSTGHQTLFRQRTGASHAEL